MSALGADAKRRRRDAAGVVVIAVQCVFVGAVLATAPIDEIVGFFIGAIVSLSIANTWRMIRSEPESDK